MRVPRPAPSARRMITLPKTLLLGLVLAVIVTSASVVVLGWAGVATVGELSGMTAPSLSLSPRTRKRLVNRGLDADTETLMLIERLAVGVTLNSSDAAEGVAAFLEKRDPVWTGS